MFGTATLSFADGIKTEAGDIFEIEAPDSACRCATRWRWLMPLLSPSDRFDGVRQIELSASLSSVYQPENELVDVAALAEFDSIDSLLRCR